MGKMNVSLSSSGLIFLLLGFLQSISGASTHPFLTMNIHCYDGDWKFRFNHILDQIVRLNPEVIALQEVCTLPSSQEENQIEFIHNGLLKRGFVIGSSEALFTHKAWDRYDEFLLLISKKSPSAKEKGLLPRSPFQRGYVAFQIDGQWYANVHLEFHQDHARFRRQQLEFLHKRFEGQPLLLAGDFNSTPDSGEQKWLKAEGYWPEFPGVTHVGDDGNSSDRIDGFWLSPWARRRVSRVRAWIVLNQKFGGQFLSDHFAVLLQTEPPLH